MKKFSIESKVVFINVNIPVEIGSVKATVVTQIIVHKNEDGSNRGESEVIDYTDISFMGMPIDNGYDGFKKFKSHMDGMGVDINDILDRASEEILTKEEIDIIVKETIL